MTRAALLEFRHVSVMRRGRRVLHDITFTVGAGENVAILGPNGSGKSTLMGLLTRELYPLADGAATPLRILGRDRWDLFELRHLLGIVTPSLQLDFSRRVTAREAVLSGFFGAVGLWRNHRVTAAHERAAARALSSAGATPLAGRFMDELSSGEARRVLIARALVHRPRALVLDEPTSSLDLRAAAEFRSGLGKLARRGTRILLVTHDFEDVIPEISRVILLKDGAVFRDGTRAQALAPRALSALFGMPVH